MLTAGSLFAGVGGFDLGLARAGIEVQWQVEVDEQCRAVLARHWPDVPRLGDVRDVGPADVGAVDILCGGFPCQDLSVAGRGAGLDGERSGLWHEFLRLADTLAPRWVLVENVPGLLSNNAGRGGVCADEPRCWRARRRRPCAGGGAASADAPRVRAAAGHARRLDPVGRRRCRDGRYGAPPDARQRRGGTGGRVDRAAAGGRCR